MISVIIPTYNCSDYIIEAIESVLNQTYKDVEIIVIDDGSTDDTYKILKPYLHKIKYIYQDNSGPSRARNVGIQEAKGEYIAFLDADDKWRTFKIYLQLSLLEALPDVNMIFSNYAVIDKNGTLIVDSYIEKGFPIFSEYKVKIKGIFNKVIPIKKICNFDGLLSDSYVYYGNIFDKLFMGNFILPSTEIIRRSSLRPPFLFNEKYKCAVDQDFHLRFSKNHKIAYIDISTTEYRINRKGQLSGKQNTSQLILNTIETRLRVINEDSEFLSQKRGLIKKVLAKDFLRLSYYYLSELDMKSSRKYAISSLRYKPLLIKSWVIFLSSFFPPFVLSLIRSFKFFIKSLSSKK